MIDDPALTPYLRASGEEAERCLSALLGGETDRTIRAIIARTLCGAGRGPRAQTLEAEDVRSDVVVQVLARLRRLKTQTDLAPIENFGAYVASIAYRTCYSHLRRLYPQRARLKNRLRYALTYNADLTLEQDALGIWRCGLTRWNEESEKVKGQRQKESTRKDGTKEESTKGEGAATVFRRDPAGFARNTVVDPANSGVALVEGVTLLLERIGEPVDFDLLVDAVGGLLGVDQRQPLWNSTYDEDAALNVPDPNASVAQTLLHREHLVRLWHEVRDLPVNQRSAVLLNLRDEDGQSALPLLPLTGIATIRQIAEVLEIPAIDLAGIWNSLPLDDLKIAERLTLTRQQVINLRKSARERLARRMARW